MIVNNLNTNGPLNYL